MEPGHDRGHRRPHQGREGSEFIYTGRGPLGREPTTTFVIDEFEDLHEIKLRCQRSGFYSHWLLTEAQGQTYTEVELGVERVSGLDGLITGAMHTKGYLRRAAETTMDSLRRAVSRGGTRK